MALTKNDRHLGFSLNSELTPIVLLDFKVAVHSVYTYYELINSIFGDNKDMIEKAFRAIWAYKFNRGPCSLYLDSFRLVVADDKKARLRYDRASTSGQGYWRHDRCYELGLPEYKAGRVEKSPEFLEVMRIGEQYMDDYPEICNHVFETGMEADDICAEMARQKRNSPKDSVSYIRPLLIFTIDNDWLALVNNSSNVVWCNSASYNYRVRRESEALEYVLRKEQVIIDHPKQICLVKSVNGDEGDGLYAGSPLELFDLVNEHPDPKYQLGQSTKDKIRSNLENVTPSNSLEHLAGAKKFLESWGITMPEAKTDSLEDFNAWAEKAKTYRVRALKKGNHVSQYFPKGYPAGF